MNETVNTEPVAPPLSYGSFTSRMIASTIDIGVLLLVALPLIELIMAHLFQPIDLNRLVAPITAPNVNLNDPKVMDALWASLRQQRVFDRIIVVNALQILCIAIYILPFWFRYSSSPGKMLFRLIILDAKTEAPMTRSQSIVRFIGYGFSGIPLSLGFVWILFNRKRRGFHDYFSRTIVVVKPKKYTLPSA